MDRTLSLAELAEAVAEGQDETRDLLIRRIRHWTLAGTLPTAGSPHAGTGRHRRYSADTAYLVIVLHRLADWGLPIGVLKAVSDTILEPPGWLALEGIRDAIAGTRQVFLSFRPFAVPEAQAAPGLVLTFCSEEGMIARLKQVEGGMHLNLTKLFRQVAL